ncbi:hypothetical protein [Mangrovibrevibacter kandeliae]|uniref:hypothetical protein n=1 Tax=Mangrovibrevibacter kandeliae TaxID=2968473 RepID=UPI002118A8B3|nr:hypothetical protein [Aurantimonas sp. CSK15Z-1]MCQ8781702.1 hypothetical protein [Aurantimonas sp. CSK15Z-1]
MDKPILFSGPMVRATLNGRKTQDRRTIKRLAGFGPITEFGTSDTAGYDWHFRDACKRWHDLRDSRLRKVLPYAIGDALWVQETWQGLSFGDYLPTKSSVCEVRYAATDPCADLDAEARGYPWRSSIHMPREFSRLTLIVTDVRVQRLQDISEADAVAEGVECDSDGWRDYLMPSTQCCQTARESYRTLWDSINGKRPGCAWADNPWVVAISFEPHRCNIDALPAPAHQPAAQETA